MIKKTYEENLSLYVLYEVVSNLYYSQYPSYPNDIKDIMLKLIKNLTKYIDHPFGNCDIRNDKFIREITYSTLK